MPVETGGSLLAGRYRIVRPLGYGGMATVFLCEDERLGRRVAVKRLHAHSADDVARRFVREARLGAALNHPNLVSVFDTTPDEEAVLIVMEYVEGETLRDLLGRGPLPPERATAVVRDVAGALDHAHSHGVVHRDIKPGNILLRHDGVTKLTDLGIATAADVTRITKSGVVLGTASYMAPEQLEGRSAGPRADVYALATVAFEALSGRKARPGRTPMEIAHRVATEPPPDLCDAWAEAPGAAAAALRRAMSREPEERHGSAGELAAELEGALEQRRAAAPPPAATEPQPAAGRLPEPHRPAPAARRRLRRAPRPRRASPGRAAALAGVLLALAAAAALAGVLATSDDGTERAGDRPADSERAVGGDESPSRAGDGEGGTGEERDAGDGEGTQAPPEQDAAPPASTPAGGSVAEGRRLNGEGYRLMKQGRYDEAVQVLRRAVGAFPEGTSDIHYAYALYNLGRSLRLSGRPDEAIPILERRLEIPNQTGTVRRELQLARRDAARG